MREHICFIHSKTHIKLHVPGTQSFEPRSLYPLCSEAEVTIVAGRSLKGMISEFTGPNLPWTETALFDPKWTVVVDARVAVCVLRIDGINIVSTTGNNVGTTSSFKEILAPG